MGAAFGEAYPTPEARQELANLVGSLPPVMVGRVRQARSPSTSRRWAATIDLEVRRASMALIVALWSILALSGTLAGEARRGSLDFVATTPLGMRRIAVEKLAAHLTGMAIVVLVDGVLRMARRIRVRDASPGDAIPPQAAIGFALWIGVVALASAASRSRWRRSSAAGPARGIAGAITIVGYFVNGYQAAVPAFGGIANLTSWGWTAHHQPLAAQFDWASLIPVAIVAIVLFVARRRAVRAPRPGRDLAHPVAVHPDRR